jgi:hypothetical protein
MKHRDHKYEVALSEEQRYTVMRVRERFVNHGLDDALTHRHAPSTRSRALDGEQEAHLIALSCSPRPDGQARWTLRLLADGRCARSLHPPL